MLKLYNLFIKYKPSLPPSKAILGSNFKTAFCILLLFFSGIYGGLAKMKSYLFLTRQFRPYTPNTVDRQMVGLRKKGLLAGLKFLKGYRFHQARATFCTWLLTICLEVASVKASIEFTKRIMLHKHESTTFKYVLFIEHSKAKIEISNEFTKLFFGMKNKLIE